MKYLFLYYEHGQLTSGHRGLVIQSNGSLGTTREAGSSKADAPLPDEVEDLRKRVQEEIELELRNRKLIEKHPQRARKFVPVLVALLVVNIVIALTTERYSLLWIISSFWVYMYFFVVIMFPTTRKVTALSDEGKRRRDKVPYRLAGIGDVLRKGKRAVIVTFWNSFFIGTRTMARGIAIILAMSFIFALVGARLNNIHPMAAVIVLVQGAAIILFYLFIMRYRPYSKDFLNGLYDIQRKGREMRWETYLRGAVAIVLLLTAFAILTIMAMLFPRMSLDAVLAYLESDGFQIDLFDAIVIFATQFILVRYVQGFDSARFASAFIEGKIDFLQNEVLSGLDSLGGLPDDERGAGLQALNSRFLMSRLYLVAYKDLFGFLPSYPLIVDFRAVLEEDVIEAMSGEMPLDIPV